MKTTQEWFNTLPKDLKKAAIINYLDWPLCDHRATWPTMSNVILMSFIWNNTKEGTEFWDSFFKALLWAEEEDAKI